MKDKRKTDRRGALYKKAALLNPLHIEPCIMYSVASLNIYW